MSPATSLIGTALPLCEYRADQAVNRNLPAANKSSDISRPLQAAGGSPVSCRSRIHRQILRPRSTFRAALGDGPLHRIGAANEKTFGLVGVEGLDRSRGRVVELPWKMRKVTTPSQVVTVAVCDRGGHRLAYSRPPSPESLIGLAGEVYLMDGNAVTCRGDSAHVPRSAHQGANPQHLILAIRTSK